LTEFTMDSGAAVTGLKDDLGSPIRDNQTEDVYVTATGEHVKDKGLCVVQAWDEQGIGMTVRGRITEPGMNKNIMSASSTVKAGNRVVLQQGYSYVENLKTKKRTQIHEKNGVYVMPLWVKKKQISVMSKENELAARLARLESMMSQSSIGGNNQKKMSNPTGHVTMKATPYFASAAQ